MNHKRYSDIFYLIVFAILFYFIPIYIVGPYAWDDGAITISYARTFAETAKFALTPISNVSEGTSSLLYMFMLAGICKTFQPDFYNAILISKILSFIFLLFNIIFIYVLSLNLLKSRFASITLSILYLLIPMNIREVINGMEMIAFGTLLLLYVHFFNQKKRLSLALIPLILLCRFEAIFYLGFSVFFLFAFSNNNSIKSNARNHLYAIGFMFLIITAYRVNIFGSIFPNAIWAKMNPPYSSEGVNGLLKKALGVNEFLLVFGPLISSSLILFLLTRVKEAFESLEPWLITSFAIFAFITGKNWGYDGRMFLGILPTFILWQCRLALETNNDRPVRLGKTYLYFLVIIPVSLMTLSNFKLVEKNLKTIMISHKRNLAKEKNDDKNIYSHNWYGITPENYKLTGEAVLQLSNLVGKASVKFAAPDVGGLGLCCKNIEVLDTGLLTNPFLARNGYTHMSDYLETKNPDFIETHGDWSRVSKIYEIDFFKENYLPLIFRNNLFWARKDIYRLLTKSEKVKVTFSKNLDLSGVRYANFPEDKETLSSHRIAHIIINCGMTTHRSLI